MDPDFERFATDYQRFFAVARRWASWARFGPTSSDFWLCGPLGKRFSPYRPRGASTMASMRAALGLDDRQAQSAWQLWLASHGLFALTVYRYGTLSKRWLQHQLLVDQPEALRAIVAQGGLVLTGHTHHHNTLGSVLGLSGCHITGLASSATGSPLYPYIGEVIEQINNGSARHFGGGSYLYTDELKTLVRETKRLYADRKVIVSLCDFSQSAPGADAPSVTLLGRELQPPTGAIDLAQRFGVPIHAAFLFPHGRQLRLVMRRLDASAPAGIVLQQYFDTLAQTLSAFPWSWQGWDWFHTLPSADTLAANAGASSTLND
jgi:hypothetical protein